LVLLLSRLSRLQFCGTNVLIYKSDTYLEETRVRLPAALAAVLVAAGCWEAWHDSGSIAAAAAHGFLPYAVLAALVLAVVAAAGATALPRRAVLATLGLLGGSACWAAISLTWSPAPSLARDEALLTAFYLVALATPVLSLTTAAARTTALAALTGVLGVFTLAVAVRVGFTAGALSLFQSGRLYFPITYANAQAALFALGIWPALLFATRARGALVTRALGLGGAALFAAAALLTQSKGTTLGLAVSLLAVVASSPLRLRLLPAAAVVAAIEAAAFRALTGPYRNQDLASVHAAGRAVLLAGAAGAVAGGVLALADRRLHLTDRQRRLAGRAVAALALLVVVAGAVAFVARERHPVAWTEARWASFKHFDPNAGGTSHLTALGSNRYDFWRVALVEWKRHPLTGCGARCFGPEYLILGRSTETPARAHSLPLELLAEQGLIGFALLIGALGTIAALLVAGARASTLTATAALGGFVAWLVQCCVDWTWTVPALTVPLFVLVGIGLAAESRGALRPAVSRGAGAVAVLLAVLVFAPPWLAQHLVDQALRTGNPAPLRWARRLDGISTAPLVAEAELARTSAQQLQLLGEASRREPRVLATQYFYGSVLLNTGHRAAARQVFRGALALDPGNPAVEHALRLAR
jgi:hypothetical protein